MQIIVWQESVNTGIMGRTFSSAREMFLRMSQHKDPFDGPDLQDLTYSRANMSRSNFDGVNLAESRFFAVLSDATFSDTNLARAVFDDVNLGDARFHNINLENASFDNINLSNSRIDNANLQGMTINGILVSELLRVYAEHAEDADDT